MEWLLIFGLMAACFVLHQRLQQAERRLQELEDRQTELGWRFLALAVGKPVSEESGPAVQVPEETEAEPVPAEVESQPEPQRSTVTLHSSDPSASREAAPEPEAEVEREELPSASPGRPSFSLRNFDFEEIFGRRLPIWAGGITLAVAGVFLVRYSIERGLLTPEVRVFLSFLFGIVLLAGAELAHRFEERVGDERVRQALAGAGLATLYAAFYLAGTQYELIGQTFAFLGLAGVTALSIFLSYRFGLPSAVLGLLGGFAAPALVGGEDANLPMLALYLALVTGGLTQTANRQRRSWLGLAALVGGLGWGALLLLGGDYEFADILALGLYFVLLGTVVPALLDIERFRQPIRLMAAGFAGLQLALLVDAGGYQPLAWGLYLLLGAALAWFGWKQPDMRAGSAMAAAIGVVLLALWPSPGPVMFAGVAASFSALFAGVPLALLRMEKGGALEAMMAAIVPFGVGMVTLATFDALDRDSLRLAEGVGLFALAALPAAASWLVWKREEDKLLAVNLGSAALLGFFGFACLLPDEILPLVASAIALGLAYLLRTRAGSSAPLSSLLWLAAVGTFLIVPITDQHPGELATLFEGLEEVSMLSALRWLAAALPFAAIATVREKGRSRHAAEFISGLLMFATFAQILPPIWLVWFAAVLAIAIRFRLPDRSYASLALAACIALWALNPAREWIGEGARALVGDPMLMTYLPNLRETFGFILPLAVALSVLTLRMRNRSSRPVPLCWAALPFGVIVVHTLFKHLLLLDSLPDFEAKGLAERTLWEALMLAGAWAVWKGLHNRLLAIALAAASLAHSLWFTLLWHNPLWWHQAVGQVPLANLALAAYAVAVGALLSLRIWHPATRRAVDTAVMVLATLGVVTLLRQVFTGTYLDTVPMTQAEDLLRSLVGIVMAIVFLLIGSARDERTWRLGSLVLMTATVIKVFIFDTAGLEGLIRIASFVALGASLIGIGWFYSRQLKAAPSEQ